VNLLKQTSLILGLASLTIGGWTLYRNWKQKLAIWFTILCFFISFWALSFVSHATLQGRLSKDIHWFFHVWLVPVSVTILSKVLHREDGFSRILKMISFSGATILGTMIALSLGQGSVFWWIVTFWPFLVVIEFVYVVLKDQILGTPVSVDFFSSGKRMGLYLGLAVSLITCSFDHLPVLGYAIPAIGNLLLTLFLVFVSQMVSPRKLINLQALATRFFAIIILSLVITGFFALLYQYVSESFSLFFLNSFLVTFSVLMLWSPLVSLFRFLVMRFTDSGHDSITFQTAKFLDALSTVTSLETLEKLVVDSFQKWIPGSKARIRVLDQSSVYPESFQKYFRRPNGSTVVSVIHRELIQMERDQVVTLDLKKTLDTILLDLDAIGVDVVFPVYPSDPSIQDPMLLIMVESPVSIEDVHGDFSFFAIIYRALQEVEKTMLKIRQIERVSERDRLVLMGEMAAGLAHEVRNPLGAIHGAAELVETDPQTWGAVIRDEAQRLNRLVNQFLDFAHSPSDQIDPVDLGSILQRSIENLRPFYGKQVEIEFVNEQKERVMVKGVPDHLQQILMNLIQNSIKADAKRIRIILHETAFMVEDDGCGIPASVQENVFKPFFTTFRTGTGLGLSICERLIKFSNGRISLKSTEGKGTTVTVELCAIKSSS
jgi:two-component system sensor histidine kinase HydH